MSVVIGEHTIETAQGVNILSDEDEFDTILKRWEALLDDNSFIRIFFSRKNLEIEKMIIHENYNDNSNDHDFALLKLKEKLDLSVYMPACLPAAGRHQKKQITKKTKFIKKGMDIKDLVEIVIWRYNHWPRFFLKVFVV